MRRRRREAVGVGSDPVADGSGGRPPNSDPPVTVSNPLSDPDFVAGLRTVPSGVGDSPVAWSATDVSGVGPDGVPAHVDLGSTVRPVLLVFLSTNCDGCDLFWTGVREEPPSGVDVVIVTKGPGNAAADEVAVSAAGVSAPVVMSDSSWTDFRVTSYPFLILVDAGTRRILGESVGFGWSDVAALVAAGVQT